MKIIVDITINYGDANGVCYPENRCHILDSTQPISDIVELTKKFCAMNTELSNAHIKIAIPPEGGGE